MKTDFIYNITNQSNNLSVTFTVSDIICMELNTEKNFFAISFSSGKDYIIGNNFSIDFSKIKNLYNELNKNFIDFKSDEGHIGACLLTNKQL